MRLGGGDEGAKYINFQLKKVKISMFFKDIENTQTFYEFNLQKLTRVLPFFFVLYFISRLEYGLNFCQSSSSSHLVDLPNFQLKWWL